MYLLENMSEILLKESQETCKAKKVYIASDVFSFSNLTLPDLHNHAILVLQHTAVLKAA